MVTVARPEFIPDPSDSRDEMKALQRDIASEASFDDDLATPQPAPETNDAPDPVVVGVDQAFLDDMAISAIVASQNGEIIERTHAVSGLAIDYIPGLLAFREGGPILDAFRELETEPDLAVFDGNGRIHYRQAGLATHMGVVLDLPSIGVAKRLLCGEPTDSTDDKPAGTRTAILATNRVEAPPETVLGYAVQTRQYEGERRINPVYVSPGHRVSATRAADHVETLCTGFKLPDPIRAADRYADEVKSTLDEQK